MRITGNIKGAYILGCCILFFIFPITSCVYEKDFAYINDQIIALNKRVTNLQESIDSKIDSKLNTRVDKDLKALEDKLGPVSSNQAEMVAEVDRLKMDIKELGGRVEDNEHIIKRTVEQDLSKQDSVRAELGKLDDLIQKIEELEAKVKQQQEYLGLEPVDVRRTEQQEIETVSGQTTAGGDKKSKEAEIYDLNISLFKDGKYEQASEGFKSFLGEYPKSELADNAQFWIGECHMALKQYEQAILAYNEVIKKYPKGNKVPNAMLRQAIAFIEIDDKTSAKLLLNKVIRSFPKSTEATLAKKKLGTIK